MVAFVFVQGCSWFGIGTEKEDIRGAEQLMQDGMEKWNRGDYEGAADAFQKIKDRYPYSKYAVQAELKMADSLFMRQLYNEAYDLYKEFEKLHPKNPQVPYAIYQQGMCHFKQVGSIDRDQSHTWLARDEFERLIKRFPKTKFANQGRRKLRECYIKLAEHDLYVGRFYFKAKRYKAAEGRFLYILQNYPDLGQYHEALKYLNKCEAELAKIEENRKKESTKRD